MASLGVAWTHALELSKTSKPMHHLRILGFKVTIVQHKLDSTNDHSLSSLWLYLMNYSFPSDLKQNEIEVHSIEKHNLLRLFYPLDSHNTIKVWLSQLLNISFSINSELPKVEFLMEMQPNWSDWVWANLASLTNLMDKPVINPWDSLLHESKEVENNWNYTRHHIPLDEEKAIAKRFKTSFSIWILATLFQIIKLYFEHERKITISRMSGGLREPFTNAYYQCTWNAKDTVLESIYSLEEEQLTWPRSEHLPLACAFAVSHCVADSLSSKMMQEAAYFCERQLVVIRPEEEKNLWNVEVTYDLEKKKVYLEHQFLGKVFTNQRHQSLVEAFMQDIKLAALQL